jgi:hypothetical protein
MGQHSSARTEAGRFGWRRAVIAAVGIGVAFGTIGVVGLASGTTSPTPSVYSAITPVTVLGRSLAADSNTDVGIAGTGSVPSNATSVQLSVTALDGTTTSSMYVYPTGATKPTSANVRWETGQTITIPVTVAVGTSGRIRLTTDGGVVTIKVAVVGYFSPAPAPGSAGYAANNLSEQVASNANGGTIIASVTVPAGTYEIHATASMDLADSTTTDEATCNIHDPAGAPVSNAETSLTSSARDETVAMTGLDTTSGGAMTFNCTAVINNNIDADYIHLVAIKLSSATGYVTGS